MAARILSRVFLSVLGCVFTLAAFVAITSAPMPAGWRAGLLRLGLMLGFSLAAAACWVAAWGRPGRVRLWRRQRRSKE